MNLGGTGAITALVGALAQEFKKHSPEDTIELIPNLGTGGALNAVHQGALDLVFSGRALKPSEREVGLVEIPLLETPFVFVSATPEPLRLSRSDILKIYSGETFDYPTGGIARLILRPRQDTSTQHLVTYIDGMAAALERARLRQDIPMAPSDQDNIEAMRRISGAFGGMLLTQLSMEPSPMRPVFLEGIEPTLDAMLAKTYPLKQRIYLVHKGEPQPGVKRFIAFLARAEALELFKRAGALSLLQAEKVGALRP